MFEKRRELLLKIISIAIILLMLFSTFVVLFSGW
jgi:hypothetical protein